MNYLHWFNFTFLVLSHWWISGPNFPGCTRRVLWWLLPARCVYSLLSCPTVLTDVKLPASHDVWLPHGSSTAWTQSWFDWNSTGKTMKGFTSMVKTGRGVLGTHKYPGAITAKTVMFPKEISSYFDKLNIVPNKTSCFRTLGPFDIGHPQPAQCDSNSDVPCIHVLCLYFSYHIIATVATCKFDDAWTSCVNNYQVKYIFALAILSITIHALHCLPNSECWHVNSKV